MSKNLLLVILTLTVLSFTSSVYAEEDVSISIVDASGLVELAEDETDLNPEDGEFLADEEASSDQEEENEISTNALLKPFEEYSPADLFAFLILLIKIFENVIKLFTHKWGFAKW